jgi:hypothetical protein
MGTYAHKNYHMQIDLVNSSVFICCVCHTRNPENFGSGSNPFGSTGYLEEIWLESNDNTRPTPYLREGGQGLCLHLSLMIS